MDITAQHVQDRLNSFDRSQYDATALAMLDSYQEAFLDVQLAEAAADLPIIKKLVAKYTTAIKSLESSLLTKRKMPELERENILDKIELYRDFTRTFDATDAYAQILKGLDDNLE